MNPKVILVPYSGSELDNTALKYALHLAEKYDAKIEGWHVMPDVEMLAMPALVYTTLPYYPEAEIQQLREAIQEKRKIAEKHYLDISKMISASSSFHIVKGEYGKILGTVGRLADLIVMPRTEENIYRTDAANGALFGAGRPVLFVSPDSCFGQFNGKVLIAWDGSKQAASAVVASLPYLVHNKVSILTIEETNKKIPLSALDLKMYLEAHKIEADLLPPLTKEAPVPVTIANTAKTLGCGLVVCGAWGHSKAREFLLGGVTDYMLHHTDLPVLMVH